MQHRCMRVGYRKMLCRLTLSLAELQQLPAQRALAGAWHAAQAGHTALRSSYAPLQACFGLCEDLGELRCRQ